MDRLTPNTVLPSDVRKPQYSPSDHGVGIVHIGLGAFHRAHQAIYTDDALASQGGDWKITGVSLRNHTAAVSLNPQDGLYSVLIRGDGEASLRVIGSITKVIALRTSKDQPVDPNALKSLFNLLTEPSTRIASLTVTEKAYGIDRSSGGVNDSDPMIKHDLEQPDRPLGVIGILVHALKLRRQKNVPPFTILCCDNLPANGQMLRSATLDFAQRIDKDLATFIDQYVSFPSTMVDRITPATSDDALLEVRTILGADDNAAVETEEFCQWVIEDRFPTGRPNWEAGGALFVDDVEPYEMMKLRMLNGTHSLIAYAGYLAGFRYVRDAMQSEGMVRWVRAHMCASANTLNPVAGIDYTDYARSLEQRFANKAIAHETYQIAMDGSEKLPQRIFTPALRAISQSQPIDTFAFATAAWLCYCTGKNEKGQQFALQDPREAEIATALQKLLSSEGNTAKPNGDLIYQAVGSLPTLIPAELSNNPNWRKAVIDHLDVMRSEGMTAALDRCGDH